MDLKTDKLCGFTLAEVLVTLAIIGVVAALTIPTIVRNYREKQIVTQVKKFYSTLNQAFQMTQVNDGPIESWELGDFETASNPAGSQVLYEKFKPYLKIIKTCPPSSGDCFAPLYASSPRSTTWTWDGPYVYNRYVRGVLADGSAVFFESYSKNCSFVSGTTKQLQHVCAQISVDLNANKPPNRRGEDFFTFWVTKYGVVPGGTPDDTRFLSLGGLGCSAWVINFENTEYLKCDDLSWNGKHKCD